MKKEKKRKGKKNPVILANGKCANKPKKKKKKKKKNEETKHKMYHLYFESFISHKR